MQSSPPRSEGKARAIRALSRSLNDHSTRSIPSPSPPPSDSNPTQHLDASTLDFFNHESVLMSTQHRIEDDTNTLPQYPRIRSTAKKVGSWQMNRSEQPGPDTSMVNKQFNDFDHSISDEEDISIEQGRGGSRINRSTPAGVNSSLFNSLYDMTPPSGRPRKSYPAESGSLRRDAQIRRASRNEMETASPRPTSKRMSLAQSHAKISEAESSIMEERPPTLTLQAKSTRWGNPRSRQTSLQLDGVAENTGRVNDTFRSRPVTSQTGTAQSFMLPDIPNLTELVSGVFQDGTPVFSKTTPARSRFAAPNNNNGRASKRKPSYIPVDSVPIPDEEKAIFASLHLLQERVTQLEHERAEAEKRLEEQEVEIIELRASAQSQERVQRPDSGLGSTDGEGSGKSSWKIEKTRLQASVQAFQKRLERSERKLSVTDIEKSRLQKERDNVATQLAVAFQNFDELKREKEALHAENDTLRQEIDTLRAENDTLRDQLEHEQEQYREETAQLRHQVDRAENVTVRENETLRHELTRIRAQHDENTQNLARKDAELRKARKDQAEYAKLKADNEVIKKQLAELKAKREQEMRSWSTRESELKGRVDRRDETIRHFQDMTQEQTNEAMRLDNDNLRHELAQLASQHEEDVRRWAKKEDQLRRRVDSAREKEGLTREILSIRQANGQQFNAPASVGADKENHYTPNISRKPSQRREDTRTRIASRVQQEVRNSRPMSSSHAASEIERSPRKSYTKPLSTDHRASLPANYSRSFSAPVSKNTHAEVTSDIESTTDLSIAPRGTPYVMRGSKTGMSFTTAVEPPPPMELTELSFINVEEIAALRRQLEEERAGVRTARASSAPLERQTREDTIRSITSIKSKREQSLPRKSSMKDLAEPTNGTIFEDLSGRFSIHDFAADEQTQQTGIDASMLSNTSRRRRSAPVENMTSAFIVPDIKISSRKEGTKLDTAHNINSHAHDNDNCTVCRREGTTSTSKPLSVPKLIPASSRMPDDIDATLRPARSPKEALALVVKELLDERAHLHIELAVCRANLETHDPSQGMKKRQALNAHIQDLLRQIEVKDTQIYHLYDVLEGQDENDITEQDVEELTRSIRIPDEQPASPTKKKEKRVVVQSFHGSEDDGIGAVGDESDEELPWEGFEDTQDLDLASSHIDFGGLNNVSMGRRGSVY